MKILLADDDPTSRTMLNASLRKWGFEPVVARDGLEAWDVLSGPDAPHLVLLDWNMPGLDGLQLTQRLRSMVVPKPFYILILTARGDTTDIVQGLKAGADDFVSKPYNGDELRARLDVGRRVIELQNALAHAAMHDQLTGVLNRGAVLDVLRKEIARADRERLNLGIGLMDVDHFKSINDTFGHLTGDDVLKGLATVVQSRIREYDHFGRYGGEEFLVIVPGCGVPEVQQTFARLCRDISETAIDTRKGPVSVSVSIGTAHTVGDTTVDAILAVADAALYQAKQNGRNQIV